MDRRPIIADIIKIDRELGRFTALNVAEARFGKSYLPRVIDILEKHNPVPNKDGKVTPNKENHGTDQPQYDS